jgi:hypothetical protein
VDTVLWIFGSAGAIIFALLMVLWNQLQKASDKIDSISNKVTRLETINELRGYSAANILHSSVTPELDKLLDKFKTSGYVMTDLESGELLDRCDSIERDDKMPKDQRSLASEVAVGLRARLKGAPPSQRTCRQ